MKAVVSLKDKGKKGESRSIHNIIHKLHIDATMPDDLFILAAIGRALFGTPEESQDLRAAIMTEAAKCRNDHNRANHVEQWDDSVL